MSDLHTYDRSLYLLGATYQRSRDKDRNVVFSDWNQESDLTGDTQLKNVRPISFTPILIDALSQDSLTLPRFWGSDQYGRLCKVSYLSEAIEGKPQVLLRQNSPLTTIDDDQSYEMLFPPTNLIGQLAQSSSSITQIKERVKSLYTKMSPRNGFVS
ncbi:hypothetical protein [Vibrio diabolicus]|uniref:Uncharacterized protein n=1 Tax=Vibrio diabolicus TaxID=50719 RepID=A0AA92LYX2_9VIBR|nr:hypothetical protein [Vibrio diabolicus]QRG85110.1 hypothetical protein JOS67_23560 [Vibrio diabolicus]